MRRKIFSIPKLPKKNQLAQNFQYTPKYPHFFSYEVYWNRRPQGYTEIGRGVYWNNVSSEIGVYWNSWYTEMRGYTQIAWTRVTGGILKSGYTETRGTGYEIEGVYWNNVSSCYTEIGVYWNSWYTEIGILKLSAVLGFFKRYLHFSNYDNINAKWIGILKIFVHRNSQFAFELCGKGIVIVKKSRASRGRRKGILKNFRASRGVYWKIRIWNLGEQ